VADCSAYYLMLNPVVRMSISKQEEVLGVRHDYVASPCNLVLLEFGNRTIPEQ
jgi:hypothetical protein